MKKVIYPGPAVPPSMAESGYYPFYGVSLGKGENELDDATADKLLESGQVLLPEPPAPAKPSRKATSEDKE